MIKSLRILVLKSTSVDGFGGATLSKTSDASTQAKPDIIYKMLNVYKGKNKHLFIRIRDCKLKNVPGCQSLIRRAKDNIFENNNDIDFAYPTTRFYDIDSNKNLSSKK